MAWPTSSSAIAQRRRPVGFQPQGRCLIESIQNLDAPQERDIVQQHGRSPDHGGLGIFGSVARQVGFPAQPRVETLDLGTAPGEANAVPGESASSATTKTMEIARIVEELRQVVVGLDQIDAHERLHILSQQP